MKQIKIKGKLSLDKMTIAKLNEEQSHNVVGGDGFLSIGKNCTQQSGTCCPEDKSKGLFCPNN